MLLLLTTLALAQDPAPEGETQSTPVSETETSVPSEGLTPVVKVVAPKAVGTYKQGYDAGRVAAEEFVDWLQPAVAGAGVGAGAAGVGVVCGGVVCGAPAVLGGAGYQTYKTRKDVPAPPPGEWQQRSAEFQTGFIQGFQARANQKRTRWALAGGATGAVVGAGVGLVVVAVLYDRQGRDFI